MFKICFTCKINKPVSDYWREKANSDGFKGSCKDCLRKYKANRIKGFPSPTTLLRLQAIEILGRICCRCGFDDIRALQIDHKNGGGRKEVRSIGSYNIYKLIANGSTADYQVLCANCNWIKSYENKELNLSSSMIQLTEK